jgi:outer membrane protein assembly factor BamB
MRRLSILLAVAGCNGSSQTCDTWTQWGQGEAHAGSVCAAGQPLARELARIVYDPFNNDELADPGSRGGELLVHYQGPLVVGDDVYMMSRGGTFTPCTVSPPPDNNLVCDAYRKNTLVWLEKGFSWQGGNLVETWTFVSDWKPMPSQTFEPMFQPAIAGDHIFIPGAGGSIYEVDRHTGRLVRQVKAFGDTVDPDTYVAGGIGVAGDGTVWYTAIKLNHDLPYTVDAAGWVVKVPPGEAAQTKSLADLVTGAPAAADLCKRTFVFGTDALPWPPPDDADGNPAVPRSGPCGSQRPAVNAVPAIGADGTAFIVSKSHFNERYGYITAVRPDLTTKWATSLRDFLDDGCGVLVPANDDPAYCRSTARVGVDPATNDKPAGRVTDQSSSSPVALPDGGVLYGSFTGYNGSRGHLLKVSAGGELQAAFDFGWDTTPAIYQNGGSYSVILKENNYAQDANGVDLGPFYVTQLAGATLTPEWQFKHADTQSCTRGGDNQVTCVDDHPNGFEWCINAPAVDSDGTVYALNENGRIYAIRQGGTVRDSFFLDRTLGAAYTPLAIDASGRIYAMNFGILTVLGR